MKLNNIFIYGVFLAGLLSILFGCDKADNAEV